MQEEVVSDITLPEVYRVDEKNAYRCTDTNTHNKISRKMYSAK